MCSIGCHMGGGGWCVGCRRLLAVGSVVGGASRFRMYSANLKSNQQQEAVEAQARASSPIAHSHPHPTWLSAYNYNL